ncbi:hypothetical protein KUTeg_023891 [Tegillarca granosa]|uniref:Uncharacterized protein n=1 Tax=Tegillarca granosa TaxID=220873 RepID=A0ABQ9DZ95_TEGGR|nr:hypothetical protein KUTeg_023891 [Tegillarca granosa]
MAHLSPVSCNCLTWGGMKENAGMNSELCILFKKYNLRNRKIYHRKCWCKYQHVPLRTITIKEGKDTCKVSLWRDNAAKQISTGVNVLITNVIVNSNQNEVSLSSTLLTTIENYKIDDCLDEAIEHKSLTKGAEETHNKTLKIIAFEEIKENLNKITIWSDDDEEFEIEKKIFQTA